MSAPNPDGTKALRGRGLSCSCVAARTDAPNRRQLSSSMTPQAALVFRRPRIIAALHGTVGNTSASCAAGSSGRSAEAGLRNRCLVATLSPTARPPRLPAPCSSMAQTAVHQPAAEEAPAAEWQQRSPEVVAAVDGNPTGMQLTFLGTGASALTPGRHAC